MRKLRNRVQGAACWMWHTAANGASAEFILCAMPNGGAAILFRSLWVTAIAYGTALLILCASDPARHSDSWAAVMQYQFHHSLPWIGAIFGAVYLALYARFAAQWAYLSSLYNEIMAVCACNNLDGDQAKYLALWKAAFIDDAITLHLSTKPTFAMLIRDLLRDDAVQEAYADACFGRECGPHVVPVSIRNAAARAIRRERQRIRAQRMARVRRRPRRFQEGDSQHSDREGVGVRD